MSYIDQSRKLSPGSMVAVIGVHAAIAAALLAGLSISEVIKSEDPGLIADNFKLDPPPPPAEDPIEPVPNAAPSSAPVVTPVPLLDLKPARPPIESTPLILPPLPQPTYGSGIDRVLPSPTPSATFDPVGAKPRNDPARWLTDRDYKPSWARLALSGLARFRLEIAANGTVTDCTVTGSTGHSELDAATCRLISRRAKFEPARGSNGEPVAGSYSGSVMWKLPD